MEIGIIIGLILLNGIFSMSEIAVISARKSSLNSEAKQGSNAAQKALNLANNPDNFLSTVQVGITLIGIVTGLYSGDVLADDFAVILKHIGMSETYVHRVAQLIIVVVVTYFTIIFGELVPKRIGLSASEKIAKVIAYPMHYLSLIASPFVWVLSKSTSLVFNILNIKDGGSKVTEEEIRSIVREGKEDGAVQEVEQDIVERVFNLGDRNLESIMTHRADIVWIDTEMSNDEILDVIRNNPFDKYPVGTKDLDHIEGIVYLKDMFGCTEKNDFNIREFIRPVQFFYENMEVYNALAEMKAAQVQYALVCDEFGTVNGVITLKDILEALVGTILDPHEEPDLVLRKDGSYLVDGQWSFYDFLNYFDKGELYTQYEYNTISGLILDLLGHIPIAGEEVEWNQVSFEIMDMDGVRIDKVLVKNLN